MVKKIICYLSAFLVMAVGMSMNSNAFASTNNSVYNGELVIEQQAEMISGEAGEEISPLAINYYTVYFTKTSSTKAKARVIAEGTALTTEITSKITLQKYNSSTGSYSNVTTVTKKVSGTSITHEKTFTISSTGKYRIKVTLYDGSTTQIKYKTLS